MSPPLFRRSPARPTIIASGPEPGAGRMSPTPHAPPVEAIGTMVRPEVVRPNIKLQGEYVILPIRVYAIMQKAVDDINSGKYILADDVEKQIKAGVSSAMSKVLGQMREEVKT